MQLSRCILLTRFLRPGVSTAAVNAKRFNHDFVKCDFVENEKIAILKLNDPKRMNAVTQDMALQFVRQICDLKTRDNLRGLILTGEGKAFSSGGDLDWLLERHKEIDPKRNEETMFTFYSSYLGIRQLKVPIVAAINGAAIGAGLSLAIGGCDMRIAHPDAVLGSTFVKIGLHPGMAITHFLPPMVGQSKAFELLITGRTFSAQEALEWGIVSQVSDDPVQAALDLCLEITKCGPRAVEETIKTLRRAQETPNNFQDSMMHEAAGQAITYHTKDFREGIMALKEKRDPNFT